MVWIFGLIQFRIIIMNKETKIEIVNDKINQLDIHIDLLNGIISSGSQNKPGLPSFENIKADFISGRQALLQRLDELI